MSFDWGSAFRDGRFVALCHEERSTLHVRHAARHEGMSVTVRGWLDGSQADTVRGQHAADLGVEAGGLRRD